MKKLLSVLFVFALLFSVAGCSSSEENTAQESDFKVGMVCIGDTADAYTAAHVNGLNEVCEQLGITAIYKYSCGDGGEAVQNGLEDLVEEGCDVIIANSYGHQSYTLECAKNNPDIFFQNSTGDNAAVSGLTNYINEFPRVFEARYVAGVVAGMKLKELIDNNKLSAENFDADGNPIIGYVSAFPYAECISGYTSYYLGVKSIVDNVVMYVTYTSDWSNANAEKTGAETLMAKGAVIISQHADTVGAPSAVEEAHKSGKEVYCVGYNASFLEVAPESCLTSATNNWANAYYYLINNVMNGNPVSEWVEGFETNSVGLTELGKNVAAGTKEKVDEVISGIKDGSIHVFDVSKFTIGGVNPTEILADLDLDYVPDTNMVSDGYFHEQEYRCAPYFATIIDGIVSIDE